MQEHRGEYPSLWAAIEPIAPKIGCVPQTLNAICDARAPCPLDLVNRQFRAQRPNQLWVSERQDFDLQRLDDTRRPSIPSGDDTEGAGLWERAACMLKEPDETGSCPLHVCKYKARQRVGFVVIEVERRQQ